MPRPIKYATATHSLTQASTVSAALVGDGSAGSATPGGRCRLASLECTITSGTSLSSQANVTAVYLAKDADGYHPITTPTNLKLGTLFTTATAGFTLRLEQDAYIEGPIYAVAKLATGDSGTGTWKLTFVQGG